MSEKGNQSGHDVTDPSKDVSNINNPGHPNNGEDPREDNIQFDSGHDISKEAKITLGNYLSDLTKGKVGDTPKNTFAQDAGIQKEEGFLEVNADLTSKDPGAHLDTGGTLGSFLDVVKNASPDGSNASEKFKSLKHSDYVDNENPFVGTDVKEINGTTGHNLLISTVPVESEGSVGAPKVPTGADHNPEDFPVHQQKISEVLKMNRFNPSGETPFMQDNEKTNFGYSKQEKMGEYDSTAGFISEAELKKVGLQLIINATGHTDFDIDDYDAALLPSLAQFTGFPVIDEVDITAQGTKSGEKLTKVRSNLLNGTNNRSSYGQLNSNLEHFAGPMPIGMVVNTVSGMAGLLGFAYMITSIIEMSTDGGDTLDIPFKKPIKLAKGRHANKKEGMGNLFYQLFGIPRTDYPLNECIFMGMVSFYGIKEFPSATANPVAIMDSVLNIAMAPGYYNVVTRNVMRDTEQIADAVSDFASTIPTPTTAITGIFKLIESIVNSASYRFIMAMAALGNQQLMAQTGYPRAHPDSRVDSLPDTAANRHKKSRIANKKKTIWGQGSNTPGSLTWRHASAPSRYLLPKHFRDAVALAEDLKMGNPKSAMMKLTAYHEGAGDKAIPVADRDGKGNIGNSAKFESPATPTPGRLPSEYVEWIEENLESEYMPFYFHDLRTNEIISFHAFLNDLSDGFSAEYSNSSGYGRSDDVMIYQKTSRNISLSFTVAATSKEDLDVMYFNINKLVSMMYPQYSRGRTLVHGSGRSADRFIQPFSQIPTASPMIRLRFGDIVKSNYSKFNIARLFGMGQPTSAFNLIDDDMKDDDKKKIDDAAREAEDALRLVEGLCKIDPGDTNANQASALAALGASGTTDDELGWNKDDIVQLDPAILYWPRNVSGKQARENSEARSSVGKALDLYSYGTHTPSVKIIARVTTAGAASPSDFSAIMGEHEAAGEGYREPTEQSGKEMGYLVQIQPGTPTMDKYGSIGSTDYTYHRAEHSEILGWDPDYRDARLDELTSEKLPGGPRRVESLKMATSTIGTFLAAKNNPIIRSFESSRGKGLAGFMTELNFDWAESTWETDTGSRAPKMMKVSVTFKPIHDVPMGLDSDGMMRSVAYPVGISRDLNGTVYSDAAIKETSATATATATEEDGDIDESKADAAKETAAGPGLPF